MATSKLQGPRLPYAVIKLEGKVKSIKHGFDRKTGKITTTEAEEPAGWLVGYPDGHYLRIRRPEDMRRYGVNKRAKPISADSMMLHPSEKPDDAFANLEADIWAQVRKVSGNIRIPGYSGKIEFPVRKEVEDYA